MTEQDALQELEVSLRDVIQDWLDGDAGNIPARGKAGYVGNGAAGIMASGAMLYLRASLDIEAYFRDEERLVG